MLIERVMAAKTTFIGVDYHPDGDAVGMDGFVGVDGETSPETGDYDTIIYIILAAVSLLAIVLLNVKKKENACR